MQDRDAFVGEQLCEMIHSAWKVGCRSRHVNYESTPLLLGDLEAFSYIELLQ
jgi:hypothetical protein